MIKVDLISRYYSADRCFNRNKRYCSSNSMMDTVNISFKGQDKDIESADLSLKSENLSLPDFQKLIDKKLAEANSSNNKMKIMSELTDVLDLYLQKKWTQPGKKEAVLEGLKRLMGERGQGNIIMAQTNPIPGNVEANALKTMSYINAAEAIGADTIIFPEMALMGYPIHDAIERHPVIVEQNMEWLKGIAKKTGKTRVIIGFVEPRGGEKVGKQFYNSVAVLGDGKILGITRKSLLPTYSEFNESRYMQSSPVIGNQPPETLGQFGKDKIVDSDKLNEIHEHKYGIVICEDGWNDKDFFKDGFLYDVDPVEEIAKLKPEAIINCSASPSRERKEQLKHNMLQTVSRKHRIPMIYVNQVGAVDDSSFDGSSRVYDRKGNLVARAKSFEEQFMICNPLKGEGVKYPLAEGLEETLNEKSQPFLNKEFSLEDYKSDLGRTYKTIIQGIRDYFSKNGFKKAVLGLSGGLDSSVCAVLLADALGPENVYGISMPSKITSQESKNDARILASNLGIHFAEVPIGGIVKSVSKEQDSLFKEVAKNWNGRYEKSYTGENNQARTRALMLWGLSNEFPQTLPIATSDKSELYMGYATINGDMSGGFAPIADLTKTKTFALARWMNENREIKNAIPESVIAKPPGAELSLDSDGRPITAESVLMPYEFLDEVIWRIENKHQNYNDMVNSKFLYEKNNITLPVEKKETWLGRFFSSMSKSLYKWFITPPSVLVGKCSINKANYRQPVTSGSINYMNPVKHEITKKLNEAG